MGAMTNDGSGMRVTLLGTGTSTGVPVIGCGCRVCTSPDVRDQRTRCSCLIEHRGLSIVIDTGPDFRLQALREGLRHVDAVLFTHHHFDHIVGIDDLRPFFFENDRSIPCYARENTTSVLQRMFNYIFQDGTYPGVPDLTLHTVEGPFAVSSRKDPDRTIEVIPVDASHGDLPLFGYRIGSFAYVTDTNFIPDESFALLEGLDVLVLDALRENFHPTHYTIDEAVAVAERIGARQTYFTHMTHSVLHAETDARLPDGSNLAYDGLAFTVRE